MVRKMVLVFSRTEAGEQQIGWVLGKYQATMGAVGKACHLPNFHAKIDSTITKLIIYMKKLLDSDWLRAVQFKCNTSAKSVTSVLKV